MNRDYFNKQYAILINAFSISQKLANESQDVYWGMLGAIPDEKFAAGVRKCLAECKFFPTIAELGEASLPTITVARPYNARIHQEPRKVGWEEQLRGDTTHSLPPPRKYSFNGASRFNAQEYLTRVWKAQDEAGLPSYNNPDWYKPERGR